MNKTSEWLTAFRTDLPSDFKSISNKAKTISVTGGKGGVGKTSIALKTAKSLVEEGSKVLLIDCDYNLSNSAIKLGIPLNNNFSSLIMAEKSFSDCLYKDGNFHLLPACNGNLDLFEKKFEAQDFIIDIINSHATEYDYIILDTPAGLGRDILTLCAYCDYRFVVVTPDKSSITDSYSLIKLLNNKFGIKDNHLIVNMYKNKKQFLRVVKTISETVETFLNCRTHIVGGVSYIEEGTSSFDKIFLDETNNTYHKKFLKMLNSFTDREDRSSLLIANKNAQALNGLGQEVR
jgi:flagellar biosynthesis protein FlhG